MVLKYEFDKEYCWYKNACSMYNTEDCASDCIRYLEMYHLMNLAQIPKKRQYPVIMKAEFVDVNSFKKLAKIKNNIVDFVNNGESLYLFSESSGNGKTTWSLKLIQKYFDKIWSGNGFECQGLFIHVPTFLNKIKENINNPSAQFNITKKLIEEVPLVIWDDVVISDLKNFDYTNMLSLIDTRLFNQLSNIYTGNLNSESMLESVGDRLHSRIYTASKYRIELKGSDRRGVL